jgi:Flp pilus assembly pilin Flp
LSILHVLDVCKSGLVAAAIAVAIITVTKGLGSKLNTTFTSVQTALK